MRYFHKQMTLDTVPEIMCLHIKRFAVDSDPPKKPKKRPRPVVQRTTKIEKEVTFPMIVDLSTYVTVSQRETTAEYLYDLYAVCHHHGNMEFGHYTAQVQHTTESGQGQWVDCNDDKQKLIQPKEVKGPSAYIFFYVRRDSTKGRKRCHLNTHNPNFRFSNITNNCFINAIVQCLLATTCLAQFFSGEKWREDINEFSVVAGAFAWLVNSGPHQSGPYYPVEMIEATVKFAPAMITSDHRHQDGHEFLRLLLNSLEVDLTRKSLPPPSLLPSSSPLNDGGAPSEATNGVGNI
jgi:ubiquitin C-terminal hydrolase